MDNVKIVSIAIGILLLYIGILYALITFAKMPAEILQSLKAVVPLVVGVALIASFWKRNAAKPTPKEETKEEKEQ